MSSEKKHPRTGKVTAATSEKNHYLIDLSYLNEIGGTNKKFINEVLDLFMSHIPQELSDLDTAIDQADFPRISSLAHKIKSSVPFVGLYKTHGPLLEEMESWSEAHTGLDRMRELFQLINASCRQVIEEIPLKRPV